MDPGILLFAIPVALTLYVAWLANRDAYDPLPFDATAETVRLCLDWEPLDGVHADVSACRCKRVRVALTGDGDAWKPSSVMLVEIEIGADRDTIHDLLDDAANDFLDEESGHEYERITNRRGEHN